MSYPEPPAAFSNLVSAHQPTPRVVSCVDSSGLNLEVQHITHFGWSIEVRLDETYPAFWRQPHTGAQATLSKSPLSLTTNSEMISCSVGDERCVFARQGASFSVFSSGREDFKSSATGFSYHVNPVTLCEQIISRKVTDLSGRTFGAPGSLHYETHMVRFQYPRPSGVVLGLAGQTGELNRNGYRFELYNTDEFVHTPARKPLYQSWPIVFHRSIDGERWVGIFNDNPSRTFVDLGDFYPDKITFESILNNARVYICSGATLEEVSHKMAGLLGGMSLPPLWAFGYQQCRWSYLSTNEVRSVAARMRESDIPLDAIYFDIDYMDGYRVFRKNEENFGDIGECVKDLHAKNVHAVAIVDPGVKIDPEYSIYNQTVATEAFLKLADGTPLPARVWPGQVLLPDFGNQRMQEYWSETEKQWLLDTHLDGIWNDMNEPANFDGGNAATAKAETERGSFRQESNLYGYHMAATSALGWQKAHPHKRGVVITRAGYPGVQQRAVIWHGDNQTWWEHMRLAIDTALAYSISGAYYTGPDVPGFTGNPPDDLAVRFYQLGAFLPLFRGHSIFFAKDKEPYAYTPEIRALIRDAIRMRYSLLREWYSGFEQSIRTLQPALKPVFTAEHELVRDQFLLFNKLLIAPIIERDQRRKLVYLPAGTWYELGDQSSPIAGDQWLTLTVTLESVPVYVRAGTVLTRNTVGCSTAETLALPEVEEVYRDPLGGSASGYWYGDDGASTPPRAVSRRTITR